MGCRRKFVMGNWKMNGDFSKAQQFFDFFFNKESQENEEIEESLVRGHVDVSLAIPSVYLKPIFDLFNENLLIQNGSVSLGAQNLSEHLDGAFTGELSATMLIEAGAKYVIVGHSERRQYCFENDVQVAQKAKQASMSGLVPVICIGESLEAREKGETENVVESQLRAIIDIAGIEVFTSGILAYEPVWAIGTGLAATPGQVQSVHAFLRKLLAERSEGIAEKTRIVYGGSLKPSNAQELFDLDDVDGGLIGGASLKLGDFLSIVRAAVKY